MNLPAPFENLLSAKRTRLGLLIFVVGLLALPAASTASGIYHRAGSPISWRPALDYFEWLAAGFGLLCCVIAPFFPKISIVYRIFLCLAAVGIYAIDLGFSTVASMVVFGPSF